MTKLLLVRHGQSEWNAMGRWQGKANPPLTDLGKEQALLAAKRLIFWLWGPLEVLIDSPNKNIIKSNINTISKYSTDITIRNSSSRELWEVIYKRVNDKIQDDLINATKVSGRTKNGLGLASLNAITNKTQNRPKKI